MNRSPLSVTVEWEISKTCLFMIESSSSNCNCLLSRLCILSWPAAPCNGFQWCQRHDRRCRCRTSRSSRGVETMQKPWFQEGWIFRQNFDGENEIVIIDLTTTNKKNQHKYLNRVDLMNNSGTISLWLPSSIQRRPGQRSCNLSMFGIYISILVFRILGIYISIWYFWCSTYLIGIWYFWYLHLLQ